MHSIVAFCVFGFVRVLNMKKLINLTSVFLLVLLCNASAHSQIIGSDGMMHSPLDRGRDDVALIRVGSYAHPQSDQHTICVYGVSNGYGQNVSVAIRGYEHQCPFDATYNILTQKIKLGSRF
jgi:hypothetical protein